MKKSIKYVTMIAFAAIAGYGVYINQSTHVMSDLLLSNVEALARYEGDGYCHTNADYTAICNYYDSGNICPCGF